MLQIMTESGAKKQNFKSYLDEVRVCRYPSQNPLLFKHNIWLNQKTGLAMSLTRPCCTLFF